MPIDTLIDGDPESIRQAARWLRSNLSTKVVDCVTDIHHARTESEWAWGGEAGAGFHTTMTSGARKGDDLAADADTAGRDFETHADNMVTALAGMDRARQIALDCGLDVVNEQILEPGPAPSAPQGLPTDGSATAAMVQSYDAGIQAQQVHAQWAAAYAAAADEAANARRVVDDSISSLKNKTVEEFRSKKPPPTSGSTSAWPVPSRPECRGCATTDSSCCRSVTSTTPITFAAAEPAAPRWLSIPSVDRPAARGDRGGQLWLPLYEFGHRRDRHP